MEAITQTVAILIDTEDDSLCGIHYNVLHLLIYPRHHFVGPRVIENIKGVSFPKYKVVEYRPSRSRFDRSDKFSLEIQEVPTAESYEELDEHFDCF